jgi:hypothetical protein
MGDEKREKEAHFADLLRRRRIRGNPSLARMSQPTISGRFIPRRLRKWCTRVQLRSARQSEERSAALHHSKVRGHQHQSGGLGYAVNCMAGATGYQPPLCGFVWNHRRHEVATSGTVAADFRRWPDQRRLCGRSAAPSVAVPDGTADPHASNALSGPPGQRGAPSTPSSYKIQSSRRQRPRWQSTK